ncbi:PilT/PilU family type 4a pilus ATPase [Rubellicoccus peritrichatus]|uniref:PilT/PilU family type 4a pilus ATPase n=1 Tax=Rubellicoccus peritrichatus TaxID=3080537 RepID=A0AAQ3L4W1_9BACT|nr:PilT/PilU family type 4a pilus ATPase [Puniceicoccus sp. CR14]WOO39419.1 PilT/PilU family type 4a pilus ATPase [Puniceicoccus sp. CR14]
MNNDVQWLAHFGIQEGFLNKRLCKALIRTTGKDADLLTFGQTILEKDIFTDFDRLQELMDKAWEKGKDGPPPDDPFILVTTPPIAPQSETKAKDTSPEPKPEPAAKETTKPEPIDPPEPPAPKAAPVEPIAIEKAKAPTPAPTPSQAPSDNDDPFAPPPRQDNEAVSAPAPAASAPKRKISRQPETVDEDPFAPPPRHDDVAEPPTPTPKRAAPATGGGDDLQSFANDLLQSLDGGQKAAPKKRKTVRPSSGAPSGAHEEEYEEVARRAPAPKANPADSYSNDRPQYSLKVPSGLPDFKALSGLGKSEARQFLIQLLLECQKQGASDLHLSPTARPFMRKNRRIQYLSKHILTAKETKLLNTALLSDRQNYIFESTQDYDFAMALDATKRFRVNLMVHKNGTAGTYRFIPNKIQSLEALGFDNAEVIRKLLTYHNGLILVTGPVGAGKTATLASLVDELNKQREDHIITVEAPIEIVQTSNTCQITQREVGSHTNTFHSALKGALRQDPDIIVIGEMRDLETIEMAISASETGHLVIGTMHTSDAATTLNRLLDVFPAAQQTQIRAMVSESLKGVICQRLLLTKKGDIALAYEVLLNNIAVANLIRENKPDGLVNAMETGMREGMCLMDKSIMALWENGTISDEVALENIGNKMMRNQISPPPVSQAAVTPEAQPEKKKRKFF